MIKTILRSILLPLTFGRDPFHGDFAVCTAKSESYGSIYISYILFKDPKSILTPLCYLVVQLGIIKTILRSILLPLTFGHDPFLGDFSVCAAKSESYGSIYISYTLFKDPKSILTPLCYLVVQLGI